MIFEPVTVQLLLDRDRVFYRPAGEDDLAAVHRSVVAGTCGELLGYGARRLFLPDTVPVFLFVGARLIAGFHAPSQTARDFARERALDYAFYLNQPVRFSIG
jgi:hypothetical protein